LHTYIYYKGDGDGGGGGGGAERAAEDAFRQSSQAGPYNIIVIRM